MKNRSRLSLVRLLPQENKSSYVKWVLIGFLVRLAFMPFTLHGDMVDMNRVASYLAYRGFLPPHQMGYPPLAYYTMAFFQWLFKPVMPYYASGPHSAVSWVFGSHVFRYSFLLKSYYLIFDFGIAFLLINLLSDKKKKLLAFKLWMLNPVVIFTSYIQGQFDVLPAFFVVLSLYYALTNKSGRSLFWLGIGIALKNSPLFLVIPALVFLGKVKLEKFKLLLLAIIPYIVLVYPYLVAPGFKNAAVTSEANMRIFNLYFRLGGFDKAYVFIVGYVAILIFAYFRSHAENSKDIFRALWRTDLIIFLWFFSIIQFHPQWFVWVMPLLTLFIVENKKLRSLYWIQIICLFIYTFRFGNQVIVSPFVNVIMDPDFHYQLKSPSQIISRFYPPDVFINIFRSIFLAISIWMIYQVYKGFPRKGESEMLSLNK